MAGSSKSTRRLFMVEGALGILLLVIGVIGGLTSGSIPLWFVGACGLAITVLSLVVLRRNPSGQHEVDAPKEDH